MNLGALIGMYGSCEIPLRVDPKRQSNPFSRFPTYRIVYMKLFLSVIFRCSGHLLHDELPRASYAHAQAGVAGIWGPHVLRDVSLGFGGGDPYFL